MKSVLALIPVTLLAAACASRAPADPQAVSEANEQWQSLRAAYTTCAKDQADAGMASSASAQDLTSAALKACRPGSRPCTRRFAITWMHRWCPRHGRDGARQAADQVSQDTEAKTRNYLVRYVERERYTARAQ